MPSFSIPRTIEDVCNPRELALVVYDMQVGIVRQVASGDGDGNLGRADV